MYLDGMTVKSVDMVLISEENYEISIFFVSLVTQSSFDLNFAPTAKKLLILYSVDTELHYSLVFWMDFDNIRNV